MTRNLTLALIFVVLLLAGAALAPPTVQDTVGEALGLAPWHRLTADEAYLIGTRDRFAFVAMRPLSFERGRMNTVDGHTFPSAPQGDGVLAAFVADGSLGGRSQIVIFGNVGDPGIGAIAHEYGHALLWDYLARPHRADSGLNVAYAFHALSDFTPGSALQPQVAADRRELLPLLHEYERNRSMFGPYGSTNFGEWFAEASRSFVYGRPVPPLTTAFLRAAEKLR